MEIYYVAVMSNHYHALVWAADTQQLADFMEYVNGYLAREVNRPMFTPPKMPSESWSAGRIPSRSSRSRAPHKRARGRSAAVKARFSRLTVPSKMRAGPPPGLAQGMESTAL